MTKQTFSIQGTISVHPRGFGFLEGLYQDQEITAFIAPPELNFFIDADLVSAQVFMQDDQRYVASNLVLLQRQRSVLFGTVVQHRNQLALHVDRSVSNTDWPLLNSSTLSIELGEAIVGEIHGHSVFPVRKVQSSHVALERVLVRHAIRSMLTNAIEHEIQMLCQKSHFVQPSQRRDLRSIPTITIDSESTTDIDDALAALPADESGALRVLISIADVDEQVPEGSAIDHEAQLRGTSVYLVGHVIPMIPHEISSDFASLREDVDRNALTVELRIDAEGSITSVDIYESVIRSTARLSYTQVDRFLQFGDSDSLNPRVIETLRWLRTGSARLSLVRAARGGIELERNEAYITVDSSQHPIAIESRANTEAHRLVERFMVAANEAVAQWLVQRGLPGIFRVHEEPTSEQVLSLAEFARNFGLESGFGARLTPRAMAAFERQFRSIDCAPALHTVIARTLGPAYYSTEPREHFGLAASLYLHFTSPIRRYADLLVHRIVKRYLRGDRSQKSRNIHVDQAIEHLNQVTQRASKAEAEYQRILAAKLFSERIGEVVFGNIVAIRPFGLIVQLRGLGVQGTLPLESIPGGPYSIDSHRHSITGANNYVWSIGMPVRCVVHAIDEALGRIELLMQ